MYQGRYQNNGKAARKPARRRKLNKYFLVTLSLFLLLGVAGGATLAYIIAGSETVENSFTPAEVLCSVDNNHKVTNDGNVDAYVRAAVIINWGNDAGDIYGLGPRETTNYTLELGEGWEKVGEYYYYQHKLTPEGDTKVSTPVVKVSNINEAPEGFKLIVEVLAEAIQAEGMGASSAQDAWAMVMPATGN